MESLPQKYITGEISVEEASQVLDWLLTPEGEDFIKDHINKTMELKLDSEPIDYRYRADSLFSKIKKRISESGL